MSLCRVDVPTAIEHNIRIGLFCTNSKILVLKYVHYQNIESRIRTCDKSVNYCCKDFNIQ